MNSAVKEAHRLVDEAASHIASLKTILDHGSLPPLPDSLDAEPQHEDPSSAVMSVAEQQDDDPNKDDDPKTAKKKHASAVMSVGSTSSTTRGGGGGGGGSPAGGAHHGAQRGGSPAGGGSPAALITALDASRSTEVAAGRVEMRRDATRCDEMRRDRATERHDERLAAEGRHTADGLRHRAGASSPNDFQKALAEYKRQNRVTSRS
jgi:hypothetical protein